MRWLVLALLATGTAAADTVAFDDLTRPCRVERLDRAYAFCLDQIADQREIAMQAAIGQTLSGLQAATGPELRALEADYDAAQATWQRAVAFGCDGAFPEDVRARATCRLQAVLAREEQLALSLSRAADDLGGAQTLDIPVPDSVEVLIPLLGAGNGPRQRIRVPLVVPISP